MDVLIDIADLALIIFSAGIGVGVSAARRALVKGGKTVVKETVEKSIKETVSDSKIVRTASEVLDDLPYVKTEKMDNIKVDHFSETQIGPLAPTQRVDAVQDIGQKGVRTGDTIPGVGPQLPKGWKKTGDDPVDELASHARVHERAWLGPFILS